MKNHYYIQTPHGIITRKSPREYTHAVYDVIGEAGAHTAENVSFCGSAELARKESAKRQTNGFPGNGIIVIATKKGGAQ